MQKLRLLRLAPSGSITNMWQKYHSLDMWETMDFFPGFSEFNARICSGTFNGKVILNNTFYLYEVYSKYNIIKAFKLFISIIKIVRKHKINIIHSNTPYHFGLVVFFAAKLLRKPFCVSIHADYQKREALQDNVIPQIGGSLKITEYIEKFIYKKADLVLPIRESMVKHLVNMGCNPEKIRIFPHGIDMSPFLQKSETDIFQYFNVPENAKIISSAGRIEKENYSNDILETAIKISEKNKNVYFIICGMGSQYSTLKNKVEALNLQNRIFFTGNTSNKIVIELRKQSYVNLCLMAGFSLIEACAAERPVISYDVEWHYELVKNDETGYLIEEHNTEEIANKISYLLGNPEKANELGRNAKKLAFKNHSVENVQKIKTEIYKELLNEKRRK